jgi:hypothetical protein
VSRFIVHRSSFVVRRSSFIVYRSSLAAMLFAGILVAQVKGPLGTVERLGNGNTLVTDMATDEVGEAARVVEVDSVGQVVWAYLGSDVPLIHSAHRLLNGNTLLAATGVDRVFEVEPGGRPVWSLDSELAYPNEAVRLGNGNTLITDRDHNRVIEVMPGGAIVWSYDSLDLPHGGSRLANGNTLVCNSQRNRVVEVDSTDKIVWEYGVGLNWPRSAQRLANGNTLISSSGFAWATEVTSGGRVVRVDSGPFSGAVYNALRLDNGHTLVSADDKAIELDSSGSIAWCWPGTIPVQVDTLRVLNPASGCSLYVHVHRPLFPQAPTPRGFAPEDGKSGAIRACFPVTPLGEKLARPATTQAASRGSSFIVHRLPGVVLVPDSLYPGTVFDLSGLADLIAADGFVVLHFDADGRGQSPGPAEDFCGSVHQDGLHACFSALARRTDVDSLHVGVLSQGYGVTMAAGALARYSEPAVSFLIDDEGPADRYQSCADSGGPVPVAPDSAAFWQEREAARFAKQVPAAWLRVQTQTSHNPRIPDNRDCIALIDSATNIVHGGSGISRWTRVDDSVMNRPNQVYADTGRPAVIPDVQEYHTPLRYLLYLRELTQGPASGLRTANCGLRTGQLALYCRPNPAAASLNPLISYSLPFAGQASLKLFDATGRLVRVLYTGYNASGSSHFALRTSHFPRGVYLLELVAGPDRVTRKLVLE